jgi:hypothetical protein
MTKLASTTVGVGGTASITFSGIPQNYTDLVIKISGRTTEAANFTTLVLTFNGSASGYSRKFIQGYNSSVASGGGSSETSLNLGYINGNNSTASTFGNMEVYIPNYTSSNNKSVSIDAVQERNDATHAVIWLNAAYWENPSAVNTILLTPAGGSLAQHSTVTLYGVKNAAQTAGNSIKATGGNISFDGTYVYHVFNSTGAFTPTQPIYADYLVVAGGGAGAGGYSTNAKGAGGGAGGYISSNTISGGGGAAQPMLSLSVNPYTVTIGAGATGVSGGTSGGTQGTSSSLGGPSLTTITAVGGGGGATFSWVGTTGGSGGGGFGGAGYAGTTNQGYAGGLGLAYTGNTDGAGGSGGGAGSVGSPAMTPNIAGNGGSGLTWCSFVSVAGGGGGGSVANNGAATHGGGRGGSGNNSGEAAAPNTGGGGGGGSSNTGFTSGGNGGSGIIIIRYKG